MLTKKETKLGGVFFPPLLLASHSTVSKAPFSEPLSRVEPMVRTTGALGRGPRKAESGRREVIS